MGPVTMRPATMLINNSLDLSDVLFAPTKRCTAAPRPAVPYLGAHTASPRLYCTPKDGYCRGNHFWLAGFVPLLHLNLT